MRKTMSYSLDEHTIKQIDVLSATSGLPKSALIAKAVSDLVKRKGQVIVDFREAMIKE